jgi:predicted nucleic acid-binding protein
MNNVLIDTSAWIDFLRSSKGKTGDLVAGLIRSDKARITGPVIAELLHGIRNKKEVAQLDLLLETIPCQDITRDDWQTTGNTLRKLRKKGLTIPLTDVLIATVAQNNRMAVLTLDKHFLHLPVECLQC